MFQLHRIASPALTFQKVSGGNLFRTSSTFIRSSQQQIHSNKENQPCSCEGRAPVLRTRVKAPRAGARFATFAWRAPGALCARGAARPCGRRITGKVGVGPQLDLGDEALVRLSKSKKKT